MATTHGSYSQEANATRWAKSKKEITPETIETIYTRFNGVTWYLQKLLNVLYSATPMNGICNILTVDEGLNSIMNSFKRNTLPASRETKELLIAIAKEIEVCGVTSGEFVKKYSLSSSSSVQSTLKGLLEKDFITNEQGAYRVYDQFFGI